MNHFGILPSLLLIIALNFNFTAQVHGSFLAKLATPENLAMAAKVAGSMQQQNQAQGQQLPPNGTSGSGDPNAALMGAFGNVVKAVVSNQQPPPAGYPPATGYNTPAPAPITGYNAAPAPTNGGYISAPTTGYNPTGVNGYPPASTTYVSPTTNQSQFNPLQPQQFNAQPQQQQQQQYAQPQQQQYAQPQQQQQPQYGQPQQQSYNPYGALQ